MKRVLRTVFLCVLWVLFSLLFVSWLFDLKTDPAPEKQLVLVSDGCPADTRALEKALLPSMPAGIAYIRVHTLDYAFFDTATGLTEADLYILPGSEAAEFTDILTPVSPVYTAGSGRLTAYYAFDEGGAAGEDYTLYYRERGLGQAHKDAALALAETLLSMD